MADIIKHGGIVKGSIHDVAQQKGISVEQAMLEAEVIVIVDHSGSMNEYDGGSKSRYIRAMDALMDLQAKHQGKIAVMAFDDEWEWSFKGTIPPPDGGTKLVGPLEEAQPYSEAYQIILITDGEPFDKEEAIGVAKTYHSPIQVIYIGRDNLNSEGYQFLRKLANATGGKLMKTAPELIAGGIKGYLT